MAFIVLLVGLLGGALVSLLVISTTLAAGSFRIASLKQQNASLAQQQQLLANQVAELSNPAQIAREARQLGMRQNPYLRFINLKTGKIVTGRVSRSEAAIHVPGFTP
jgi:cell division protein FtsL